MSTLEIRDLHVSVETKEGPKPILRGVDLTVASGETHAIMGPNGSGKSTLAYSLAGHPKYQVTSGTVTLDGEDVLALTVDERARAGLFLAMQYPVEVPGVSVSNFLRTAKTAIDGTAPPLRSWVKDVRTAMDNLRMDPTFAERSVNEGFSGGEKKRHEILQMELLKPTLRDPRRDRLRPRRRRAARRVRGRQPRQGRAATSASCSSRTTRASCATSRRTSCTSSSTARSPRRAGPSWPTASRTRATTASSTSATVL